MSTRSFHRRYLPHLYYNEGTYFITYRLDGTLPVSIIKKLCADIEIKYADENQDVKEKRFFKKYDDILDKTIYGPAYLKNEQFAEIVKMTLHYPDGKDYFLICYCVMSNHVHLVFDLLKINKGVSKIMQSIKRVSATESNKILNKEGAFWQDESFDRLVRDDKELFNVIKYVINNPVKAGLANNWTEWPHTYLAKEYWSCF